MVTCSRRAVMALAGASLGATIAGCLDAASSTRWSKFRAAGNNEASDRFDPGSDLDVGWSVQYTDALDVAGPVAGSSTVASETMGYVAVRLGDPDADTTGTGVLAVDLSTGEPVWRRTLDHPYPTDAPFVHPPLLAEEYLLVVTGERAVVFDRETGLTALDITLPWVPQTAPGGDRYLVALGGDLVAMVDLEEARDVRWARPDHADRSVVPITPLTVLDDRLYVPADNSLIAIRRGDGAILWDEPLPSSNAAFTTSPLVDGHHLHLRLRSTDGGDEHVALARGDRSVRWREPLGSVDTAATWQSAYRSGRLFATAGHALIGINVGSGDRAWEADIGLEAPYPTVGGSTVYALGGDTLAMVDTREGTVLGHVDLPGIPSSGPIEAVPREEVLLVGREDQLVGLQPADP